MNSEALFSYFSERNFIGLIWDRSFFSILTLKQKEVIRPNQSLHLFVAIEEPYEAEVSCTVLK